MDDYAAKLKEDWGLREDDMLCLIYNNGESCSWLPNQAFFDYYNFDSYDGLNEILEMGYQADPGSNYESALKNFYEYWDYCYAVVHDDNNIEAPVYTEMAEAYVGRWEM